MLPFYLCYDISVNQGKGKIECLELRLLSLSLRINFALFLLILEIIRFFIKAHGGIDAGAAFCEVLEYVYGDCDFGYACIMERDGWYEYDVKVIDDLVCE